MWEPDETHRAEARRLFLRDLLISAGFLRDLLISAGVSAAPFIFVWLLLSVGIKPTFLVYIVFPLVYMEKAWVIYYIGPGLVLLYGVIRARPGLIAGPIFVGGGFFLLIAKGVVPS